MKFLIINMLDDFHNIHGIKVPTNLTTSTVYHMASSVVDVHSTVPAIQPEGTTPLHRPVTVSKRGNQISCPGGIGLESITQIMTNAIKQLNRHFLDSIPTHLLHLKAEKLQQSLQELR